MARGTSYSKRWYSRESITVSSCEPPTGWLPRTNAIRLRKAERRCQGTVSRTWTAPLVGWRIPDRIFIVVVLPAPFGPMNPAISPGAIVNDTSSRAWTVLYSRRTSEPKAARSPLLRTGAL